jgi:hypothetical protein
MRVLPKSRSGTWLLAASAWTAAVAVAWTVLPVMPRAEWLLPADRHLVGFGADGPSLVTLDVDRLTLPSRLPVRLIDPMTGTEQRTYVSPPGQVTIAKLSPDGRWLALDGPGVHGPGALHLLDLTDGSVIPLPGAVRKNGPADGVQFAADSRTLAYLAADPGCIRTWRPQDRAAGPTVFTDRPFALSADGRALAAVFRGVDGGPGVIGVWALPAVQKRRFIDTGFDGVLDVALSADGQAVAAMSLHDDHLRAWRVDDGAALPTPVGARHVRLDGFDRLRMALTENGPDGFARITADGVAYTDLSYQSSTVSDDAGHVLGLAPGEDAYWAVRRLVELGLAPRTWAETGGRLHLFEIATGRSYCLGALKPPWMSAWAPDGRTLATAYLSAEPYSLIQVWDIPPQKPLSWFLPIAAVLALPPALWAWRRCRRFPATAP